MNFEAALGSSAFEDMDRLFRGGSSPFGGELSEKRAGSTGLELADFEGRGCRSTLVPGGTLEEQ